MMATRIFFIYSLIIAFIDVVPVESFSTPPTTHHFLSSHSKKLVPCVRNSNQRRIPNTQLNLALRRRLFSEDDLAKPPNEKVIDAVESMGESRVIASDVATKSGVSLSEAKKSLSALAALTGGDLAVSQDGELIYIFEGSKIRSTLASKSARYRALQVWEKQVWPKLFYGLRVTFGLVLFISIFAIFSTIFFISTASSSSDDDDRRGGNRRMGGGYGMNNFMFDMLFPRNYFFYQPSYGYYSRVDPFMTQGRYAGEIEEEEEPNLLERVFSYIFGDGNPNRGLEAARLKMAARVIRDNDGAVVAEQLAPFADVLSYSQSSSTTVDESFVLPIVSQLGGEPTVTDDGDIVYVFPDLQTSASTVYESAGLSATASTKDIQDVLKYKYRVDTRGAIEKKDLVQLLENASTTDLYNNESPLFLEEKELEFNRNGQGWNLAAGVLGAINLGGALYLTQLLNSPALAGYTLPAYYGVVQAGLPLLLVYGVLFNVIPAVRYAYNQKENGKIRERNQNRSSWLKAKFSKKLVSAASFGKRLRRIGNEPTVYNTQDDLKEQKTNLDFEDFDKLLGDTDEKSFE